MRLGIEKLGEQQQTVIAWRPLSEGIGESVYSGRFKGRVAVITGGASGVGLGAAARIAAEGGKVGPVGS